MESVYTPSRIEMLVESVINQLQDSPMGCVAEVGVGNDSEAAAKLRSKLEERGYNVLVEISGEVTRSDFGTCYLFHVMHNGGEAHA